MDCEDLDLFQYFKNLHKIHKMVKCILRPNITGKNP